MNVNNRKIHECILNINIRVANIQDVKSRFRPLNIPSGDPLDADVMFFSVIQYHSGAFLFKIGCNK